MQLENSAGVAQKPDLPGPAGEDPFTKVSQAGWNGFTRFLLINVVVIVVALLVIGLFTVWS